MKGKHHAQVLQAINVSDGEVCHDRVLPAMGCRRLLKKVATAHLVLVGAEEALEPNGWVISEKLKWSIGIELMLLAPEKSSRGVWNAKYRN